jgi:hypothetical protein
MASTRLERARPLALLAGDGALVTAAALTVVAGLSLRFGTGSHASNVAVMMCMAAALLGPLLAWRLHGRPLGGTATLGALLGFVIGVVIVVTIIPLFLVAVAFLGAIVWVDAEALRDLSPQRRAHLWLDIARLLATLVQAAYLVGVIVYARGTSDVDGVGVLLLLVAPAAVGAAVVTVAGMLVRSSEQRSGGHLISDA